MYKVKDMWLELTRRNRLLAYAGLANLILFVVLFVLALVDSTTILGINRWIKPMKFSLSITIFLWTMGWLMKHLEGRGASVRWISRGLVLTMLAEMIPIVGQPARGKLSHFNYETPFDAAIFSFMGIMIALNTLLVIYALWLFMKTPSALPRAYLWGIRLGMAIFILASGEGAYMAASRQHSVGVADGGPGLPFVNWSTVGGDLRVSHFLGLHALQIMSLAGYGLSRKMADDESKALTLTWLLGILYFILSCWTFVRALAGYPFLAW